MCRRPPTFFGYTTSHRTWALRATPPPPYPTVPPQWTVEPKNVSVFLDRKWVWEESPERTTKAVLSSLGDDGLKKRRN
ncbi:hypothetical protein AVEN_249993-1 [Araneus ventricosus]|uniref:Uncharacterized protein n=1 Tax=Araneus ventricosus TaxID=182803 RepID=A0A4Y2LQE8_ARAVE|nr:hypothetical protein AVEN_249993-1 [Araneus ventricosus]